MKKRWLLCLSLFLFLCLQLESIGLEASAPSISSTPADGSVFHGERNFTTSYGQVFREVWTPAKPNDYYHLKIEISATGYGEVAFTLKGNTADRNIGNWASEPLRKANNETFSYEVKFDTNIINEDRSGFTDEISPTTVSMAASGSAQTRSRQITIYGNRQAAITAQASTTGPSVGFVIGKTTFWKWEAGITRSVEVDPNKDPDYEGKYHVTINDTDIDPGYGSGSGNSNTGCSKVDSQNWCDDDGTCTSSSGSGVPGPDCGYNWCCCAGYNSGSTPPTDNTPNCQDCTSHCSSPCSCTNSGTCDGTVVDTTPNSQDCASDCSSPCSCTNSGTCGGTVSTPPTGSGSDDDSRSCNTARIWRGGTHKCDSAGSCSSTGSALQSSCGRGRCSCS